MFVQAKCSPERARSGLRAGVIAAVVSGIPSTLHALATGRDPLEATKTAGTLLLPHERRTGLLLAAAAPAHVAISVAWALLLARVLPRRRTILAGALAGAAIYVVDVQLVGRRVARLRALPQLPQLADHVLYGATVGALLRER